MVYSPFQESIFQRSQSRLKSRKSVIYIIKTNFENEYRIAIVIYWFVCLCVCFEKVIPEISVPQNVLVFF